MNSTEAVDLVPGLVGFWRGIELFEQIATSTPLLIVRLVVLGLIGMRLLFWTLGQVADTFRDISRL